MWRPTPRLPSCAQTWRGVAQTYRNPTDEETTGATDVQEAEIRNSTQARTAPGKALELCFVGAAHPAPVSDAEEHQASAEEQSGDPAVPAAAFSFTVRWK